MRVVIADGCEDKAVAGVVDPILVAGLRLQQGVARMLCFSLKAQTARGEQAVEPIQHVEGRIGMMFDARVYPFEQPIGLTAASPARGKAREDDCANEKHRNYGSDRLHQIIFLEEDEELLFSKLHESVGTTHFVVFINQFGPVGTSCLGETAV